MIEKVSFQVSLCASFVIEPLQDYLTYWGNEFDLHLNVSFAPYNQIFQQLLNANSLLNQNRGMNCLFIRVEDWLREFGGKTESEQIEFLNKISGELLEAMKQSREVCSAPFLIGIVPLSSSHRFSPKTADHIIRLNKKLDSALRGINGFYILDLPEIKGLYEVEEMFDAKSDEVASMPFTAEFYAALGTYVARKIRAYKGHLYKVIALDCDNTLWKGVCGEEGPLKVIIDEDCLFLQKFLIGKYNEGFLLVLCSKNNEKDVWEVFDQHPQMMLKREHIAAQRINWNPKASNLQALAKDLNLGIDSFIFVDDSEFEVEQMRFSLPQVLSINLPQEANTVPNLLKHIWQFDVFRVTEEDLQRNKMFKAEKQRMEERSNYKSLDEFLQSLNIRVDLHLLQEKDLERALQLTLRTNQFNLNGVRRTREEISKYITDPETLKWIIEVKDRFGDYGNVGLLLARKVQSTLVIETFLLSCRVLGRSVEDFVLSQLRHFCACKGINTIKAEFQSTAKNQPFSEFLERTEWISNSENSTYNFLVKRDETIIG
jgi:FkbH-like protein